MPEAIERGDLYFFYRNVVDVERASGLDDVQRLLLMMVPDGRGVARMLVVGAKRLPEIDASESSPRQRDWMMTLAAGAPEELAGGLRPVQYETETRGRRTLGEAIPAGEGRYVIRDVEGDTFFVYRIVRPVEPGPVQRTLGIRSAAGYTLAVRNPEVEVAGFPSEKPDYPERLREAFADLRWIAVRDPELLDHPRAQSLLIGAFEGTGPSGDDLDGTPDLFATAGLDPSQWPLAALERGEFAKPGREPAATEPVGDPSAGGRAGGRAALDTASAAGVAKALDGIDLPARRDDLVAHARHNDAPDDVVDVLERFPDRSFADMADVAKALGEVR